MKNLSIKLLVTLLIVSLPFIKVLAQKQNFELIKFKSDFERQVLSDIENHSDLEILLAISEDMTTQDAADIQAQIKSFKKELNSKKFENKSEEKKLNLLFNLIHKSFFLKYREISNFNRIFENKEYNCVSATALYALILKEYNIPLSIKEAPTHVYSIAYPNTKSIVLESTAPTNGYYSPSENDIQKAVSSLVELKYFTQDEIDAKGVRNVYNEFFYNEDDINMRQLAGLQYYNEAVTYLAEEEYKKALNSSYKAELLYPSEKMDYLKFVLLANVLNDSDLDKFEDITYLAQYANLPMVDRSEIINVFNTITNNQLFLKSDVSFVDSSYQHLSHNMADTLLTKNISEIYFAEFGRYYAQLSDFDKSLEFSSKAYTLNDKNVNTQALITHSIVQNLARSTGSLSTINKMDEYSEAFPFLKENNTYQSLYFFTYSHVAFNHLRADDIETGLKCLTSMESLIEKFGDKLKIDENQHGMVYAEAGAAYFRKRQLDRAERIIKRGLEIMPDHPELKTRLTIVHDEMR